MSWPYLSPPGQGGGRSRAQPEERSDEGCLPASLKTRLKPNFNKGPPLLEDEMGTLADKRRATSFSSTPPSFIPEHLAATRSKPAVTSEKPSCHPLAFRRRHPDHQIAQGHQLLTASHRHQFPSTFTAFAPRHWFGRHFTLNHIRYPSSHPPYPLSLSNHTWYAVPGGDQHELERKVGISSKA